MTWGDIADIATPVVLLPLYWLLRRAAPRPPSGGAAGGVAFMALAGLWASGHGMHLAANSITRLLAPDSDVIRLATFYDETLSHVLWHAGIVGLASVLVWLHWPGDCSPGTGSAPVAAAGGLHGFTLFLILVEAGTAVLMVPAAAATIAVVLGVGRRRLRQRPLVLFFVVAYAVALIFTAGWWLWWRSLPQFSAVGII